MTIFFWYLNINMNIYYIYMDIFIYIYKWRGLRSLQPKWFGCRSGQWMHPEAQEEGDAKNTHAHREDAHRQDTHGPYDQDGQYGQRGKCGQHEPDKGRRPDRPQLERMGFVEQVGQHEPDRGRGPGRPQLERWRGPDRPQLERMGFMEDLQLVFKLHLQRKGSSLTIHIYIYRLCMYFFIHHINQCFLFWHAKNVFFGICNSGLTVS